MDPTTRASPELLRRHLSQKAEQLRCNRPQTLLDRIAPVEQVQEKERANPQQGLNEPSFKKARKSLRTSKEADSTSLQLAPVVFTGSKLPDTLRNQQLKSYYELIEEIDRKARGRAKPLGRVERGTDATSDIISGPAATGSHHTGQERHGSPPRGSRDDADRSGDTDGRGERNNAGDDINRQTDELIREAIYGKRRRVDRDPDPSDSGGSDSSSGDESDRSRKENKRTFKRSKMAWREHKPVTATVVDPRCTSNTKYFQRYTKHPKSSLRDLMLSPGLPRGIPHAEWEKILEGKVANFDAILAASHSIGAPRENRGRIGKHEIVLGESEPVRTVKTDGQWSVAARTYGRALKFAYPAHGEEWDDYMDWIVTLFNGRPISDHVRVFEFDKAARLQSGAGTHILLCNRSEFEDIKDTCFNSSLYNHVFNAGTSSSVSNSGNLPEHASDGTRSQVAHLTNPLAGTHTSVEDADRLNIRNIVAQRKSKTEALVLNKPKYLRYNYYGLDFPNLKKTTVHWSETAAPLPDVPPEEIYNEDYNLTIMEHPELFKIITP
ncbi:hypothetical protein H0H92_005967 [Tricholoma furcatifolium]|nr:hypothetical protein H0H92_005967 [Tricholoma furcatifolium]